ncbi:MAG: beta-lactamase family protein [Gemmatimonadetes bacterium]|nr:beta-lactamase family protein [Gemmatimonadota bacterium]
MARSTAPIRMSAPSWSQRKGALVLEEYFYGYERDRPHQMRSLTKSVISLLAGAAVDRGLLRANESVVARLGFTSTENPDPRKDRITLTDLLSNQSGLDCDDRDGASRGNEVKLYDAADWPQAFMDLPVLAEPGTVGRYCSFGFMTAGRIIELAAATPLAAFAQDVLFGPLGLLARPVALGVRARSHPTERVRTDIPPAARHAQAGPAVRQRGVWQGQVISASWIDAAVAKVSRVDDSDYGLGDLASLVRCPDRQRHPSAWKRSCSPETAARRPTSSVSSWSWRSPAAPSMASRR